MKKKDIKSIVIFWFLLIVLPLSLALVKKVQNYFTEALGEPADIFVDTAVSQAQIRPVWQAFAQGGEERLDMLEPVFPQLEELKPQYIRLDHIYDFYNVVNRENDQLKFDWSNLDQEIDIILQLGATPFLSLSYMPPIIAKNGQITDEPKDWAGWQEVVKKTVEHFSGKDERNLSNIYYEIWNEPDLFGDWKINRKEKDYRSLYLFAARGAQQAGNVNSFKLGGPATTAFYKTWFDNFIQNVENNQLRLDFYSWHRYSKQPQDLLDDVNQLDNLLADYPNFSSIQKIITEWGSDPEISSIHDEKFDAVHLVATYRKLLHRIDLAFIFEIRDGPSPEKNKYWGRWGLLTYDGEKKPKYFALQLLNQVKGKRLKLNGEGSWATGFSTKEENIIYLILTNLDQNNRHFETVPVNFTNLQSGKYQYEEVDLDGRINTLAEEITVGKINKEIFMAPNDVILIKLTKIT